ncbi:MAG: TIGR00730 family Rossman fold protein [Alphaproteobacteria bacterium]|nr:TIGR00730 family Rossman fold protein [Alphaproteobacteria bacterium]
MTFKKITVFGSASTAISKKYNDQAFKLGQLIAKNNSTLVYGVGDTGMMGQVFHGLLKECGAVRGITTQKLMELQCDDPSLFKKGEMEIVPDLSTRKFMMFDEGDVMVILPGGWGTVDELAEFCVLIQTGRIKKKPMIFVNLGGFWSPMKKQIKVMYREGCLNDNKTNFIGFVRKVERVIPEATKIAKKLEKLEKLTK